MSELDLRAAVDVALHGGRHRRTRHEHACAVAEPFVRLGVEVVVR